MESIYHIVAIRVNETSWAHVWRLRFCYLGTGYDRTWVKPSLSHLRTFGCVAHVKVTKPKLTKLDDRSKPMIFVGYEPGSAAYRCYDLVTKKIHIGRDVVFDEDAVWE
jgi:hypothetical protein